MTVDLALCPIPLPTAVDGMASQAGNDGLESAGANIWSSNNRCYGWFDLLCPADTPHSKCLTLSPDIGPPIEGNSVD